MSRITLGSVINHCACAMVLLGAIGCGDKPKPRPTPESFIGPTGAGDQATKGNGGPQTHLDTEDIAKATPVYAGDPQAFFDLFDKDPGAVKQYVHKVVELHGVVSSIGTYPGQSLIKEGETAINLKVKNPRGIPEIMCTTREKQPWVRIAPGQSVKIKGINTSIVGNHLKNCIIIEAGANPAIPFTMEMFAKEAIVDPDKTRKAYQYKWILLEGEVARHKVSSNKDFRSLELKGKTNYIFLADFTQEGMFKSVERVKVGDKIKVLGEVIHVTERSGYLMNCLLITEGK